MADSKWKEAIARIEAADRSRGTGFLVQRSPPVLMTARHVVAAVEADKLVFKKGPWTLRFGDPRASTNLVFSLMVPDMAACAIQAQPSDGDWILLRLPELPPEAAGVCPLPTGLVSPELDGHGWSTYGFPDVASERGIVFGGVVRDVSSGQLKVEETDSGDLRIAGLSGGPCLVDGLVVGVIVESQGVRRGTTVVNEASTAYFLTLEQAYQQSCASFARWISQDEMVLRCALWLEELSETKLDLITRLLGVYAPADERGKRLALARELRHRGLPAVRRALNTISETADQDLRKHALVSAGACAIASSASQAATQALKASTGVAILLDATDMRSGAFLLYRAGCVVEAPLQWFSRRAFLRLDRGSAGELLDLLREELLRNTRAGRSTRSFSARAKPPHPLPLVVIVCGLAADQAATLTLPTSGPEYDEIWKCFSIQFVILPTTLPDPSQPQANMISPYDGGATGDAESALIAEYEGACNDLLLGDDPCDTWRNHWSTTGATS